MADEQKQARPSRLDPEEPYTWFDLFRRSPTVSADWFQRHWLGLILLAQLGLTTMFIVFVATFGFTGSTIFFGALAGYNLVALLFRLFFGDHQWISKSRDDS